MWPRNSVDRVSIALTNARLVRGSIPLVAAIKIILSGVIVFSRKHSLLESIIMTTVEVLLGVIVFILIVFVSKLNQIIELLKPSIAETIEFFVNNRKVETMNLKVTQNLPVSIQIKDKFGNSAQVDGAPVWSSTDTSLCEIEAAADGMSALVKPRGGVGSCGVQVTADADLGEGVKSILGELELTFLPGDAETISIAAGEPVNA